MRVSTHNPLRIELIPENHGERAALKLLLERREHLLVWWGDAGEKFTPPEMLSGLILSTSYTIPLTEKELIEQEQQFAENENEYEIGESPAIG